MSTKRQLQHFVQQPINNHTAWKRALSTAVATTTTTTTTNTLVNDTVPVEPLLNNVAATIPTVNNTMTVDKMGANLHSTTNTYDLTDTEACNSSPLFSQLRDETAQIVLEKSDTTNQLINCMERWYNALQTFQSDNTTHHLIGPAIQHMEQLLSYWSNLQDSTSTNVIYRLLLNSYTFYQPSALDALRMVQDWNDKTPDAHADRPDLQDYHNLLRATRSCLDPVTIVDGTNKTLDMVTKDQTVTVETYMLAAACFQHALVLHSKLQQQPTTTTILSTRSVDEREAQKALIRAVLQIVDTAYAEDGTLHAEYDIHGKNQERIVHVVQGLALGVSCVGVWGNNLANTTLWFHHLLQLLNDEHICQLWIQTLGPEVVKDLLQEIMDAVYEHVRVNPNLVDQAESFLFCLEAMFPGELPSMKHLTQALNLKSLDRKAKSRWIERVRTIKTNLLQALERNELEQVDQLMNAYHLLMQHEQPSTTVELMKELCSQEALRPTATTYKRILLAYKAMGTKQAAMKAHELCEQLALSKDTRLDQTHLGVLMNIWQRSQTTMAAQKCNEILTFMKETAVENPAFEPHEFHYSQLLASLAYSDDPRMHNKAKSILLEMEAKGIETSLATHISRLKAYAKMGRQYDREAPARALQILEYLVHESKVPGKGHLTPPKECYVEAMSAWAQWGKKALPDAAQKCEIILKWLESSFAASSFDPQWKPDNAIYERLIVAYEQVYHGQAGLHAEDILSRMEHAAALGLAEPPSADKVYSAVMYGYILDARRGFRKNDVIERVELLSRHMLESVEQGNLDAKPTNRSESFKFLAYADSAIEDKASLADSEFEKKYQSYIDGNLENAPDWGIGLAVLKCCARTTGDAKTKRNALDIALNFVSNASIIGVLGEPPHTVYPWILRAIYALVDDETEKDILAEMCFHNCCERECVGREMMEVLLRRFPGVHDSLPRNKEGYIFCPSSWSRNLPKSRFPFVYDTTPRDKNDYKR
jgi:galactokinase